MSDIRRMTIREYSTKKGDKTDSTVYKIYSSQLYISFKDLQKLDSVLNGGYMLSVDKGILDDKMYICIMGLY